MSENEKYIGYSILGVVISVIGCGLFTWGLINFTQTLPSIRSDLRDLMRLDIITLATYNLLSQILHPWENTSLLVAITGFFILIIGLTVNLFHLEKLRKFIKDVQKSI